MKIAICNLHVDESLCNHRYAMMLGLDILYELRIDTHFSNNTVTRNGFLYRGFTDPMKDASKNNLNLSSNWIKDKYIGIKECCRLTMSFTQHNKHLLFCIITMKI